jgi:2-polyprenyl-3-methyl-5-hydroxy-6-metoxy-1,4-benzoquinol methylase
MISNPQEMRAMMHELGVATWTLAAIGALFESGLADHLREARSVDELAAVCRSFSRDRIERCLTVAAAASVVVGDGGRYRLAEGAMPFLQPPMRAALQGEIRSGLMQPLALLDSARGDAPRAGWTHTDRALLQAQGDASVALVGAFKMQIVPALGDLAARLDRPGARFLDVGVGVGALAMAMCRAWPQIGVVGLDTFEAPLAVARENIGHAGLAERIELRHLGVEDLRDEDSFDLAWFPSFFIPESAMAHAVARIRASLRAGGWVVVATLGGADHRQRAVAGLLTNLWGGPALSVTEVESLMRSTGFATLRVLPGPGWAPALVVAQR